VDGALVDGWRLTVPAETRLRTDSRMLPTGREPVAGTEFDFREPRVIGHTQLDTAFTDLVRDPDGLGRVSVEAPDGRRLVLWSDRAYPWLVLFSGDSTRPAERRRGLAVEPMTCPPDAFRSGEDVIALQPGETATASWGIDVTGFRG
jgi:aldose 1-epimerase